MSAIAPTIAALALALAGATSAAQTVYRCGNEYTRLPCAEGKLVLVDDRTTAAQRAEAREVAQRERQLAADMARSRREEAREQRPALAASLSPKPAAAPEPVAKKKGKKGKKPAAFPRDDRDFLAAAPKPAKP